MILDRFWGHFGVIFGVTLEHFGIVLLSFLLSFLCRLDHNLGHFGTILMCVLTLFLTDFWGAFFFAKTGSFVAEFRSTICVEALKTLF